MGVAVLAGLAAAAFAYLCDAAMEAGARLYAVAGARLPTLLPWASPRHTA